MIDRKNGACAAGRGITSYLLDGVDNDSSTCSEGASRIFHATDSPITAVRISNASNISNVLHCSSSFDMTSVDEVSTKLSGSQQNLS